MRYYNEPVSFSHIIGYVKPPSQTDLDRLKALKIDAATYVGKQGLEKAFEADLMGTPGQERLEVDSKRRIQRSQGTDAEIPGTKLTLSIDARLQKLAFEALGGYNGSVVAIEPSTGEVLCLASKPSFDSSLFLGQLSPEEYKNLADDPEKPLYNRALREAYAPGSTFKTVTALAAYIAGKFDPNWTAYCNGSLKLGKGKPIKCLGHHGAISFNRAYAKSCNVYFMQLGYQQAGLAALRKASEIMGIGEKSGIDLGGEYAGTVPSEKFIRKLDRWNYIARERQKNPKLKSEDVKYQGKDQMYGGEIAQFAIGQGMVSSTAVQMANVAAFVANRGFAYTPHVVRAKNGVKVQSVIGHSVKANDAFWTSLIRAMQDVVDSGTAIRSRIAGITMAGKTGSAEVQGQHITNSWFIAFAPVDRPRIAIAVMAEKAGHGSDVAAPIGSSIVAAYLRNTYPASTTPNGAPAFLQPKGPAVVVTSLDPGTGDGEN
ncbi:MAG: hypothetical protein K8R88_01085 [Armatimonadetes bacterium]|nr:hypothetical protein [Armatimonadota bacterium]